MSVSLKKGQKVSLSKGNTGLSTVVVGLGWDEAGQKRGFFAPKPQAVDCDASAIVLSAGKFADKTDIVYFNNKQNRTQTIKHMGDNLTGVGAGDDEQIMVDLATLPQVNDRIVFVVNIYQALQRKQHFGLIRNAYIRIVDTKTNTELCRYNLSDDYSNMTAMIFGEIYRHGNEWKFNAIGQGTSDTSLSEVVKRYS